MMVKIVDHLVQGLSIDIERKKQEALERQRLETQLYRLLTEMLETERKYVRDLEQVGYTRCTQAGSLYCIVLYSSVLSCTVPSQSLCLFNI